MSIVSFGRVWLDKDSKIGSAGNVDYNSEAAFKGAFVLD